MMLDTSVMTRAPILTFPQEFYLMVQCVETHNFDFAAIVGDTRTDLYADRALVGFFIHLFGDLRAGHASGDFARIAQERPNFLHRLLHLEVLFNLHRHW